MRPRLQPGRGHRQALSSTLPLLLATSLILSACGSLPRSTSPVADAGRNGRPLPTLPPAGSGRGGYYLDDGPGDRPPDGLYNTPDAEPKVEPLSLRGNKPYVVFGTTYTPVTAMQPFTQRGYGSWYGKKFHGQKTSSGEPYDMYKMTAAHPTLPIPSYARVTNLANGRQVIVRVNDRGPFHSSRIMDLSYTAALKLGYIGKGSAELQVDLLLPDEIARINSNKALAASQAPAVPAAPAPAVAAAIFSTAEPAPTNNTRNVSTATAASTVPEDSAASQADPIASLLGALDPSAPAPDASSAPGSVAAVAGGFYLQLGAYSRNASAEEFRTRLAQDWPGNLPPVEVVRTGSLYRIHSGPFASRADADAAARILQTAGRAKPVVVQR
jgi:rare lipoprotein A